MPSPEFPSEPRDLASQSGIAELPLDDFPLGITLADGQGRILRTNAAADRLLGLSAAEHASRTLQWPQWKVFHADGSPMAAEDLPAIRALREQRPVEASEMGVERPDGVLVWLSVTAVPQGPDRILIAYADVTETHRSKAILAARARLAELAPALNLEQLLRATLDEAEDLTGSCIGFYHFMEADQENLRLQAWSTRTEAEFCRAEGKGSHYAVAQAGVWADCIRERRPLIHNDYASLPNRKGMPPGHAAVVRELVVPVMRAGRVVAILGVGNKPTDYHDIDLESVQRLADLSWDLADSKRIQDSLRVQEVSFREVILNSPLAIMVTEGTEGAEDKVRFLNRKFEELFGYTAEEVRSGADWWSLAYPDPAYREQLQSEWKEASRKAALEHGRVGSREVRIACRDGSSRFVRIEVAGLGAAQVITFTDLTERRQTEEVLEFLASYTGVAGEDFFRALARFLAGSLAADCVRIDRLEGDGHSAQSMALWCDGDFKENRAYTLAGTPSAAVVGKALGIFPVGVTGLFPGDETLRELRAESYAGLTLRDHTGRATGLIALISRRPLADSALVESVLKLVAGRAAGELERQATEASLKASELRYRTQFDRASEGIFTLNPQGDLLEVNEAFARMHGYSPEEMRTLNLRDLDSPESTRMAPERMRRLLAGEALTFEVEHFHKDGHLFPMEVTASQVVSSDGPFILCFHRDITERRQTEEVRRQLHAQLQQAQKMESLGSLAGGVAHDMNNVLGAILGLASANLEAQPRESPAYRAFDTIVRAALRGGKMVQSLLSFARQNPSEERVLDLNAILLEDVHLLERTTLARICLELDLDHGLRPMLGDAGALSNALMNLCVNSVDAMPDRGTLTLRTRNIDADWIEVLVEDNGSGMTRDVLDRVLDPFFTTKEQGKGTGLGLSMVYSTVKAHRGYMDIQSEPGLGTRVTLRFPVCSAPVPVAEAAAPSAGASRAGVLSVLVVDDDELIQDSMAAILEALGHRSTHVRSGEEALARLAAGLRPELIILDMNMPGLGGAETLPRLRALIPAVPVLLTTGRADQAAHSLAGAHAEVALLMKPFSMADLRRHLDPLQAARREPE